MFYIHFIVSENKAKYINNSEYHCNLKNNFQIQHEILRGKRLKIATFPVSLINYITATHLTVYKYTLINS